MTLYRGVRREVDPRQYKEGRGLLCGLGSRPHHLALKVTRAFLSKKKDPEENEEEEESAERERVESECASRES